MSASKEGSTTGEAGTAAAPDVLKEWDERMLGRLMERMASRRVQRRGCQGRAPALTAGQEVKDRSLGYTQARKCQKKGGGVKKKKIA
jgi:hypothetical protein